MQNNKHCTQQAPRALTTTICTLVMAMPAKNLRFRWRMRRPCSAPHFNPTTTHVLYSTIRRPRSLLLSRLKASRPWHQWTHSTCIPSFLSPNAVEQLHLVTVSHLPVCIENFTELRYGVWFHTSELSSHPFYAKWLCLLSYPSTVSTEDEGTTLY